VYWWFRRFVGRLLFRTIHDVPFLLDREAAGREASPTGGVLDSQTVKAPFAELPAKGHPPLISQTVTGISRSSVM
jgi:hypothetical protein